MSRLNSSRNRHSGILSCETNQNIQNPLFSSTEIRSLNSNCTKSKMRLKLSFKNVLPVLFLMIIFSLTACIEPPKYSDIPEITAVEFNKTGISSATENFELRIFFQDGNGDFDGGENNLFITENRTCFTDVYTIPAIERNGNIDDISGTILSETDCLPFKKVNTITDTVKYDIQIMDNAGNKSNVFTSPELYIICN